MLILLLQFCILCFIGIAWWVARRDLTVTAARQTVDTSEVQQMQETVEAILAVLEQKATEIEKRLQTRFNALEAAEAATVLSAPGAATSVLTPPAKPSWSCVRLRQWRPRRGTISKTLEASCRSAGSQSQRNFLRPRPSVHRARRRFSHRRETDRASAVAEIETAARMHELRNAQEQSTVE